jgi:hypothetical protein
MLRKRRPSPHGPYLLMQLQVFEEHRSQARTTFNLMIAATVISLIISTVGAGLLLTGQTNSGAITTAAGLVSTTFCGQLARDSSDRLTQLSQDLKDLQIGRNG